jgi:hypothetical protein
MDGCPHERTAAYTVLYSPIIYFYGVHDSRCLIHVVFTLPHELRALVLGHRRQLFTLLFDAAAHCLLTLSKDPKYLGATPAITAVLHTWGQQLQFHPHVHYIVSGGGADVSNHWHGLRKGAGDYLFPYKVMMPLYRGYFMDKLGGLIAKGEVQLKDPRSWKALKDRLYKTKWIIFAKAPMRGAAQVVEYLGRYTQKIAISNHRIKAVDEQGVIFDYKDYRDKGRQKRMRLSHMEFLRRYAMHILPPRFVRIRHYGLLANRKRRFRLQAIMKQLGLPPHPAPVEVPPEIKLLCTTGRSYLVCPHCQKGQLKLTGVVFPAARGDPTHANAYSTVKQ